MEITKENRKWLDDMNLSHPIVIAGPCSAETEDQVMKTAHLLKNTDANVYRAGIWKPRTRPGGFEGVGEIGLPWLKRVKEETGMLVTTEVGNANHVEGWRIVRGAHVAWHCRENEGRLDVHGIQDSGSLHGNGGPERMALFRRRT